MRNFLMGMSEACSCVLHVISTHMPLLVILYLEIHDVLPQGCFLMSTRRAA